MIGGDQHSRIVFSQQSLILENGIEATNSLFGWLLLGPVDDPVRRRNEAAAVALSIGVFNPEKADEQLHHDLKQQ